MNRSTQEQIAVYTNVVIRFIRMQVVKVYYLNVKLHLNIQCE